MERSPGGRADLVVGRTRELEMLRAQLDGAAAGKPAAVVLVGEPGIGKSTLLDAALRDAEGVLLTASGDEAETDLDYGIIDQLLRDAPVDAALRARLVPTPGTDPLQAGMNLLAELDELGLDRLLLVAIDDAHLADRASLDALTFVARRMRADATALLVTARVAQIDHLPTGLVRLAERSGGYLELQGLDGDAVTNIVESDLGRRPPAAAAERLRAHTAGNPLHLRALLAELDYDAITGSDALPAPRSFAALVMARIASCSCDARNLVVALSVLGSPARLTDATAITDVDQPLAALDELVSSGFVDVTRHEAATMVSFTHDLVRASVHDDLPAAERAALHIAAAAVTTEDEALGHRLSATEEADASLAIEASDAACRAAARGAHRLAARHLLGAARVTTDHVAREQHLLGAADHLLIAGAPLGEWAGDIEGFAHSAQRSHVLGRMAVGRGHFDEGRLLLEEAWRLGRAWRPCARRVDRRSARNRRDLGPRRGSGRAVGTPGAGHATRVTGRHVPRAQPGHAGRPDGCQPRDDGAAGSRALRRFAK